MTRVILAGVAGGIVLFVWGWAAHMALGLFDKSVQPMPAEEILLPAINLRIADPGLYLFPGMDQKQPTEEEMAAWADKFENGPVGVIVFRPKGGKFSLGLNLALELASNIGAALLAAFLLSRVAGGYALRAAGAALFGVVAWLSISASHGIWYLFPRDFLIAEAIDQVVAWSLAGLAMAALLPRAAAP